MNSLYRASLCHADEKAAMSQFYSDTNILLLNVGQSLYTVLHVISLWKDLLQYHLSCHYENRTCYSWLLLTLFKHEEN